MTTKEAIISHLRAAGLNGTEALDQIAAGIERTVRGRLADQVRGLAGLQADTLGMDLEDLDFALTRAAAYVEVAEIIADGAS